MGWFLFGKRKTSRSARRRAPRAGKRWDPKRTLAGLKILGVLAAVIAVICGAQVIERSLVNYARGRQSRSLSLDDIELVDVPARLTRATRDRIAETVLHRVSTDAMDGRSLQIAAMALRQRPWIRNVRQVQRLADGRIRVLAEYRAPVALVQSPDGYHMVDREAVLLPGLYSRHQIELLELPLVTGVSAAAPAGAGEPWPGADLADGLSLVRLLAGEPYTGQIRSYDVADRDTRGRIRLALYTERGMVRWGLAPGREQSVEPDAQTKVKRLRYVNQQRGSIDAGGKVVDLYGPKIAVNHAAIWSSRARAHYTVNR